MRFTPRFLLRLLVVGLAAAITGSAQTTTHLFRAGENDSGAGNGLALAATTVDAVGSTNLSLVGTGSATYTSNTTVSGSSLAFAFTGGNSYAGAVDTSLTTSASFAMELWFKATSLSTTQALFYNGDTGGNGVGLFLDGSNLVAMAGNRFMVAGETTLTTGTWYHAALVSSGGTITYFLNGASELSRAANFFDPTSGALYIGGNTSGDELFNGTIDHARIFTFTSGTFNTGMLSYSAVPEPSTYAAILGLLALGLAAWRRRAEKAGGPRSLRS
jgi:hypothetical protein